MKKKGLIAGLVTLAVLLTGSPAHADVIGGGGTSSSGGLNAGASAPGNWDRVVGIWDPSDTGAYDDFLAAAQGNGRYGNLDSAAKVEAKLSGMGILEQCKSARLIVYLRDENFGVWMYSTTDFGVADEVINEAWTNVSGTSNNYVYVTERNAAGYPGWNENWTITSGATISPKQEVQNYAQNGIRGRGEPTVICSWGSGAEVASESYNRKQATTTDSAAWTEPYSWSTSVQREITQGGIDPIGINNLENQTAVTAKTDYAAIYDAIASSDSESVQSKRNRISKAVTADTTKGHAQVNLSNNNKAGLAEGGVLSIYEHTAYASINSAQSTPWQLCTKTTSSRRWDGTKYVSVSTANEPITWDQANCGSAPISGAAPTYTPSQSGEAGYPTTAKGWVAGTSTYTNTKTLGTAANTGFWQILSVHCNPAELAALLAGVTGETLVSQTAGVNGNSTSVVNSQRYNARPAQVDFGKDTGDGSMKSRSGQLGFYDKECDLTCISNPTTATGASVANGATTNQSITTNQGGKDYLGGTLYNAEVNANYLEIFRDNADRKVTVNTSYPRNNDPQFKYGGTYTNAAAGYGSMTVPATAPVSTTITRWANGTPTSDGLTGGQFTMFAENASGARTKLFQPTSPAPVTQLNWKTNPYQSLNSTALNGFYKTFVIKATWASEANRPQVINVKWEYTPTVWTRIPATVGFSNSSSATNMQINSYAVYDQKVDGRCYAIYGTNSGDLDLLSRVQQSTGTGTTNYLDNSMVEGANDDNSWKKASNLVLKFVRAVSE